MGAGDRFCWQSFTRTAVTIVLLLGISRPVAADPLVVTPQLWVSEQYNDNIFFTKDQVSDFITSVTPSLTLQYRQPRFTAFLNATTSAQFFARQTSESNWAANQSGVLSVSYRASPRLSLTVNDAVSRVDATRTGNLPLASQPAPPAAEQPPPVEPPPPSFTASTLLPRGGALSNFVTAQASYAISPTWSGSVSYSNGLSNFNDPGGQNLSNTAGLQVRYLWDPELTFNAAYLYSRFNLSSEPDTESQSVILGAAYAFAQTWSLSGYAGLYVNRALESGGDDNVSNGVGPTFSFTLSKAFERSSALLGVTQGITPSAGVAGVSQTLSVFLRYQQQFTRDLSGWVGTNYARFDASPTTFSVLVANVGLSYQVWRYLSAGLSYSYQRSDSNQAVSNVLESGIVDGNLVSLYLSASYPWQTDL